MVAAALALMIWTGGRARRQASPAGGVGWKAGNLAPEFELADLKTGNKVRLSDFKGKAVLLNFWATWCPPCKAEIPWFVDLQKDYGPQGLQVIGVAMDDADQETIEAFANDMGVNYLILLGTEKVGEDYGGVTGLPTTFYIARDGRIVKSVAGLISHADMERNVKLALKQGEQQAEATAPPAR